MNRQLYDADFIRELPDYDGERQNPLVVALCCKGDEWGAPLQEWIVRAYCDFARIAFKKDSDENWRKLRSPIDSEFLSAYFELAVHQYLKETKWDVTRPKIDGLNPDFIATKQGCRVAVEVRTFTWSLPLHSGTTGISENDLKPIRDEVAKKISKYKGLSLPVVVAICTDTFGFDTNTVNRAMTDSLCSTWGMDATCRRVGPVREEPDGNGLLTPKPALEGELLPGVEHLSGWLHVQRTSGKVSDLGYSVLHRVTYHPNPSSINPLPDKAVDSGQYVVTNPKPDPLLDRVDDVIRSQLKSEEPV